jgi:hypothetical protein
MANGGKTPLRDMVKEFLQQAVEPSFGPKLDRFIDLNKDEVLPSIATLVKGLNKYEVALLADLIDDQTANYQLQVLFASLMVKDALNRPDRWDDREVQVSYKLLGVSNHTAETPQTP